MTFYEDKTTSKPRLCPFHFLLWEQWPQLNFGPIPPISKQSQFSEKHNTAYSITTNSQFLAIERQRHPESLTAAKLSMLTNVENQETMIKNSQGFLSLVTENYFQPLVSEQLLTVCAQLHSLTQ